MTIRRFMGKCLNVIRRLQPKIHMKAEVNTLGYNQLLEGRNVLISGSTSGIGLAIARACLDSGATTVITGRNLEKLESVKKELQAKYGSKVYAHLLNMDDVDHMANEINNIIRELGGQSIDILINNAGIQAGIFGDTHISEFDSVIKTNLRGTYFLSQLISRHMVENKVKGNILNIVSSSGARPANSPYMVSKWGIRGLTLGMAKALIPYGITVNGLAPGPTLTNMQRTDDKNIYLENNPLGRMTLPEEIASMAVVLVSGIGRSIVGDIIYMTGGAGVITYDDITYNFKIER